MNVEDLAATPRIRPARRALRLPTWLAPRAMAAVVAVIAAALVMIIALSLREAGSFARRRIEFPALPDVDAAIASAQEKLRENPQDIAALVELGTLHFEKGREFYADAINELEEARELGALDPRLFYCLGVMYQEVGLYPFALEEYRRFLRHYPDDKEVRMLAAKLLYKQGRFAEAVSEYERLKFHHPGDALVEENLGLSLWGAGDVERSREVFLQLKASGRDGGRRASFYLGQIALDAGRPEEALTHFAAAVAEPGAAVPGVENQRLYGAFALAYQRLGRWEEAKAAWERVLKAAPEDAKARAALREASRRAVAAAKKPASAARQ